MNKIVLWAWRIASTVAVLGFVFVIIALLSHSCQQQSQPSPAMQKTLQDLENINKGVK